MVRSVGPVRKCLGADRRTSHPIGVEHSLELFRTRRSLIEFIDSVGGRSKGKATLMS
jgi:hypothetical protein